MNAKKLLLASVAVILGFLLVIQIESIDRKERDTRDVWQLRKNLSQLKERTQELNETERDLQQLLNKYQHDQKQQKVDAMKQALKKLKKEAGLTEVSGQGIILTVEPLVSGAFSGNLYQAASPSLLRGLLNELNRYGAKEITIAGYRVISTTSIRSVNQQTYVNDHRIPSISFNIKVLTDDAQKLHNQMEVSESRRRFAEAGLKLMSTLSNDVELPAYDNHILVQYMNLAEEES